MSKHNNDAPVNVQDVGATSFAEFLMWERSSRDTIDVKKTYCDIAQDLVAGIVLSQIIYWHLPSKKDDHTKLRVERDGHYWLVKTREEWWNECRITTKQCDRALKRLKALNIIDTCVGRWGKSTAVHIRVLENGFLKAWNKAVKEPADSESAYRTREATKGNTGRKRIPKKETPEFPNRKNENPLTGNSRITTLGIPYSTQSKSGNSTSNTSKQYPAAPPVDEMNEEISLNEDEAQQIYKNLIALRVEPEAAQWLISQFPDECRRRVPWWQARDKSKVRKLGAAVRDSIQNPNTKWVMEESPEQKPEFNDAPKLSPRAARRREIACRLVYDQLTPQMQKAADNFGDMCRYIELYHVDELKQIVDSLNGRWDEFE